MKKQKIICVIGKTSSGKDYLVTRYNENNGTRSVCSYTNRPKRDNEINGREHYFVSKDEFSILKKEKSKDICAYTKISKDESSDGYEYMSLLDDIKDSLFYIIDPKGFVNFTDKFKDIFDIYSIYIFAPFDDIIKRAKYRSDFGTEFNNRIINESKQFNEFYNNKLFDYIVYNFDDNKIGATLTFDSIVRCILKN